MAFGCGCELTDIVYPNESKLHDVLAKVLGPRVAHAHVVFVSPQMGALCIVGLTSKFARLAQPLD